MTSYNESINTRHIFINMQGIWTINRIFKSITPGLLPIASGKATISAERNDTLLYSEVIELSWPGGKKSEAYQTYYYSLENGVITKFQNSSSLDKLPCINPRRKMFDLEFLHPSLNSESIIATGVFYCNRDSYEAKFTFESHRKFCIEYKVKGPTKDYRVFTEYIKDTSILY